MFEFSAVNFIFVMFVSAVLQTVILNIILLNILVNVIVQRNDRRNISVNINQPFYSLARYDVQTDILTDENCYRKLMIPDAAPSHPPPQLEQPGSNITTPGMCNTNTSHRSLSLLTETENSPRISSVSTLQPRGKDV